ncbi:MAG: hypothetical protein ACI4PG_07385 [Candidatus Ventricola sp.]
MRKIPLLCTLLLLAALHTPCALADITMRANTSALMGTPAPVDPADIAALDDYMAQLAILSQKDERIAKVTYAESTLRARGCGPVSMSNAVIGCLEVRDEATAVAMVKELTRLLVPRYRRGKAYLHPSLLGDALNRRSRSEEAEEFPAMAAVTASFPGAVCFSEGEIDRQRLLSAAKAGRSMIFAGRTVLNGDWSGIVSLVRALHEAGRDDILLYLGMCDAGKKTHYTPLRSGDSGHYLSLCVPVGAFWNEGALYVLDSLPRGIQGEEVSSESVYHVRYPFVEGRATNDIRFRAVFTAARVSTRVIRLCLIPEAQQALGEALSLGADEAEALHIEQMRPLVLFGGCSLLINTRGIEAAK